MDTIIGLNRNGAAIIATGVLFSILTTVAVVLRFLSKRVTNAPYGVDDWLLLIALLMFILAEALVIRCIHLARSFVLSSLLMTFQPMSSAGQLLQKMTLDTKLT